MNAASIEPLLADMRQRVADPTRQAIAAGIAIDLAQLTARALAGEDVEGELRHLRAQAASLAAVEAQAVHDAMLAWVGRVVGAVVRAVLL